jgi:hypothetical protein
MRNLFAGIAALLALAAAAVVPARATEATFERDLTVSGRVDLAINNGSGFIHLTSGPAGHVHIFARVHSGWGTSDDAVQEIAAHPPIQQIGNIVRIGPIHRNLGNVNIDYEIQAPADAYLDAGSGSGNITDDGVGANAKLSTGSGSIQATGLKGGFTVGTGSGNIDAEQVSPGDVKANTGSGSIELKNVHGGLHAGTGSGHVKVEGAPTASWLIHTGSGSVELWTENAGLTLVASTGSGGIHTDREISSQGTMDHHHVKGVIGGGGPEVRVETGSGTIRVH